MKRKIVIGCLFAVFILMMLPAISAYQTDTTIESQLSNKNIEKKHLDTNPIRRKIFVDCHNTEGPWLGTSRYPFQSIWDGLYHAVFGNTVFVKSGVYLENVKIYKGIKLIGENKETTIIRTDGDVSVSFEGPNHAEISGFTIVNQGDVWWANCIRVRGDNIIISDNIMINYQKFAVGIHIINSDHVVITNNIIKNKAHGIWIDEHSKGSIISNNILYDNEDFGIKILEGSKNNLVIGNDIRNSNTGIHIMDSLSTIVTKNNFINITDCDAFFSNSFLNIWFRNYWGQPMLRPKIIHGEIRIDRGWPYQDIVIPWFDFDCFPAKVPYELS